MISRLRFGFVMGSVLGSVVAAGVGVGGGIDRGIAFSIFLFLVVLPGLCYCASSCH